jgi:hypothetical protein
MHGGYFVSNGLNISVEVFEFSAYRSDRIGNFLTSVWIGFFIN